MIALILATICAVLVSAETETENEKPLMNERCYKSRFPGGANPYFSELTEDQKNELQLLKEELIANEATPEEIRTAITEKLTEWGIEVPTPDEQLDSKIERTEQHLEVLYRQKELREEGKSWEEIKEIIQEEFDLELPNEGQEGPGFNRGFGKRAW